MGWGKGRMRLDSNIQQLLCAKRPWAQLKVETKNTAVSSQLSLSRLNQTNHPPSRSTSRRHYNPKTNFSSLQMQKQICPPPKKRHSNLLCKIKRANTTRWNNLKKETEVTSAQVPLTNPWTFSLNRNIPPRPSQNLLASSKQFFFSSYFHSLDSPTILEPA